MSLDIGRRGHRHDRLGVTLCRWAVAPAPAGRGSKVAPFGIFSPSALVRVFRGRQDGVSRRGSASPRRRRAGPGLFCVRFHPAGEPAVVERVEEHVDAQAAAVPARTADRLAARSARRSTGSWPTDLDRVIRVPASPWCMIAFGPSSTAVGPVQRIARAVGPGLAGVRSAPHQIERSHVAAAAGGHGSEASASSAGRSPRSPGRRTCRRERGAGRRMEHRDPLGS